jgi:hypothetical protein
LQLLYYKREREREREREYSAEEAVKSTKFGDKKFLLHCCQREPLTTSNAPTNSTAHMLSQVLLLGERKCL